MIQATEAVKLILGKGTSLVGRLLSFDALQMKFRDFKTAKDPQCACCGVSASVSSVAGGAR